jgi:hypothetical protein
VRTAALVIGAVLALATPAAAQQYGFVQFPQDEHPHYDGWDYWWGAGEIFTESGNRYVVTFAYTSWDGAGFSGVEVYPLQGPLKGKSVLTIDGPSEWGHPEETQGNEPRVVHPMSLPGVDELLSLRALDTTDGLRELDSWTRTTMDSETYRLHVDQDDARLHPDGTDIPFDLDLTAKMRSAPLLAGGTGQWWYGIPQTFGYPSRSFQYNQAADHLSGTILGEKIVSGPSTFIATHEYDASPEDIGAGLAVAEATQLHPRYPQYYGLDWPWELFFADLGNGAQLMVAALHFDDTERGTLRPATPDQPTDRLLATIRLPDGRSIPIDDGVALEHLSYREFDPVSVDRSGGGIRSLWTQAWELRVRYPGGKDVPAFDVGLSPLWDRSEPKLDDRGAGLRQRIAFSVDGSYGGCPVHGFAFSEFLVNWYDHEDEDPYLVRDGRLPAVPEDCGAPADTPPGVRVNPAAGPDAPPAFANDACSVINPGPATECTYTAASPGGLGGHSAAAGDWTITIHRKGRSPITIQAHGGNEMYPCGTIRPGDTVDVTVKPGAYAFAGNPGICA